MLRRHAYVCTEINTFNPPGFPKGGTKPHTKIGHALNAQISTHF